MIGKLGSKDIPLLPLPICLCSTFTEGPLATTHTVIALEIQLRPYLTVTPVSAEDFNVTVGLELQDPGKAYPALSTCVARESLGVYCKKRFSRGVSER